MEVLKTFPDECIDLICTSPPYWGLRDYGEEAVSDYGGWRGQLGLEPHPQMYINHLVEICGEFKRVLKKSGSFYLNLGDTYYSGATGSQGDKGWERPSRKASMASRRKIDYSQRSAWLQPKQLLGIPWRVAIGLQGEGWILRNANVWHKPNHMPSSVKDRLTNSYEFVFHFVKNRRYFYDLDAIRVQHKSPLHNPGNKTNLDPHRSFLEPDRVWGSSKGKNPGDVWEYDSKYSSTDYGQTLQGFIRNQSIAKTRQQSRIDAKKLFPNDPKKQQEYINFVHDHSGHPKGKNPGDVWRISTKPFRGAHFAVFPEDLIEPIVKSSSPQWICRKCGKARERILEKRSYWGEEKTSSDYPEGTNAKNLARARQFYRKQGLESPPARKTIGWSDCGCSAGWDSGVVLDSFCGSGTTCLVARKLLRNYVGIELVPEYVEMARKRLSQIPERLESFIIDDSQVMNT